MQNNARIRERFLYFAVAAMMAAGFVYAETVAGLFTVTDTNGGAQIALDGSDGSVKFKKEKKFAAGVNTIKEASDGTDVGGMTEYGVPLFLDSGNSWGTFTSAATGNDPTASISITFDNNEGDTVNSNNTNPGYQLLLVTTGITATYNPLLGAAFTVGDRYAGSAEIRNPAGLAPPIGGTWFKFRTSDISP